MNRFNELNGLSARIYEIPPRGGINSPYGFESVFQTSQIRVSLKPQLNYIKSFYFPYYLI